MGRCVFFDEAWSCCRRYKNVQGNALRAPANPLYWSDNARWGTMAWALGALIKGDHSEQCFDQIRILL